MTKVIRKLLPLAAAVLATAGVLPAHAWEPTKPVEIVVPAGPGGAADQMVRALQGIITKHHLMKQPIVVLNMAGASGGEGLMDTKASKGNPHKLVMAFSAIYTVPASAKLPFNWRDLNPVALVALDEFLLWDNAEAPQKTTAEFLAAAKAAGPGVFKMGGTGSKREDQIITVAIEKAAGVKFSYIPYTSGGQAATQLVGKHTESNVNNPSENVAQWRAGQVRALCVLSPTRIVYKQKITKDQAWSDIPTCKETGLDVSYQMLRAFFLPGGTTPDQVGYYVDVLKQATATPEWKEYIANQALKESFLTGPDFVKFLEQDEAFNNKLMTEAGFVAK
jgi:putative tricarboxylic transport membrane protein